MHSGPDLKPAPTYAMATSERAANCAVPGLDRLEWLTIGWISRLWKAKPEAAELRNALLLA